MFETIFFKKKGIPLAKTNYGHFAKIWEFDATLAEYNDYELILNFYLQVRHFRTDPAPHITMFEVFLAKGSGMPSGDIIKFGKNGIGCQNVFLQKGLNTAGYGIWVVSRNSADTGSPAPQEYCNLIITGVAEK